MQPRVCHPVVLHLLLHIGASTKQEDEQGYAGYFGEGFKIAALCAIRDYGWTVRMSSRDWHLQVIRTDLQVDGHKLPSLGYRIGCNKQPANETLLRISPFSDEELLECVVLSFYSPANPLLGSKIYESAEAAIYLRSTMSKPYAFPQTFSNEGLSILFAGDQDGPITIRNPEVQVGIPESARRAPGQTKHT